MRRPVVLVVALLLAGLLPAGHSGASAGPDGPTADWSVEDPADHGMHAHTMGWSRLYAFADGRNTQGVVVVRHGVIVAEWYEPGAGPDSWAASWSMAKSVTSALIGRS